MTIDELVKCLKELQYTCVDPSWPAYNRVLAVKLLLQYINSPEVTTAYNQIIFGQ